MDSEEEDKEDQEYAEVILTKPLPLPTEEEPEGAASLKSAMVRRSQTFLVK